MNPEPFNRLNTLSNNSSTKSLSSGSSSTDKPNSLSPVFKFTNQLVLYHLLFRNFVFFNIIFFFKTRIFFILDPPFHFQNFPARFSNSSISSFIPKVHFLLQLYFLSILQLSIHLAVYHFLVILN